MTTLLQIPVTPTSKFIRILSHLTPIRPSIFPRLKILKSQISFCHKLRLDDDYQYSAFSKNNCFEKSTPMLTSDSQRNGLKIFDEFMIQKDGTCEILTELDSLTTLNANLQQKTASSPAIPLETLGKPQNLSTSIGMNEKFLISKEPRPILMGNFDLYVPNRLEKSSNPKLIKKHSFDILQSSHSVTAGLTQTYHKKTELSEKDIQIISEMVDVISTSTNSSAIKIHQNCPKIIIKREIRDPNGISANPNDILPHEFLGALEKRPNCQLMTSDFVICHNGDSYKKIKTENHPKEVFFFFGEKKFLGLES